MTTNIASEMEQCINKMTNPCWGVKCKSEFWDNLKKNMCDASNDTDNVYVQSDDDETEIRCNVNNIKTRIENVLMKAISVHKRTDFESPELSSFSSTLLFYQPITEIPEIIATFCNYFKEHEHNPNAFCVYVCQTLLNHMVHIPKRFINVAIKKIAKNMKQLRGENTKPKRILKSETNEAVQTYIQIYDAFTNEVILL